MPTSESIYRTQAGIPLVVGTAAALAPRHLARALGMDADELTGTGAFGWRLFGVRTMAIGAVNLTGSQLMRDLTVAVQIPDQLVFAHAYRTRSVPRGSAALAMVISGGVVATGLVARFRDR